MTAISLCPFRFLLYGLAAVLCLFLLPGMANAAPLTVTNAMPKGEVRDLTRITVRFSENMRPLGVMDEARKTAPLKLSVTGGTLPAGSFRWLDPSTLAYSFDKPVDRPLVIHAVVPRGTAPLTGLPLDVETAWEITTPAIRLTLANNAAAPLPRKNASIGLLSNYPLNTKLLREKSRLAANGKTLAFTLSNGQEYQYSQGRPSVWRYIYTIKGDLPKNVPVALAVDKGVTARAGGIPAVAASFALHSFGDLALADWSIDGTGTRADNKKAPRPENRLSLSFNNPLKYTDLLKHLTVTPPPTMLKEAEYAKTYTSTGFSLPYLWQPRTAYTVTVTPGLKDAYGTALAKAATFTFTTGDYRPFLDMRTGSLVLERALSDLFPLSMLNMGTVTATARYIPWNKDAFRLFRDSATPDSPAFLALAGARETTAVIATADRPNQTLRETLDLPKILNLPRGNGACGLVSAALIPPGDSYENPPKTDDDIRAYYANRSFQAEIQITDLGIAARLGGKQGLAWVTALHSGKPVPGAELRLLDKDGGNIWSGKTDGSGIATLPGLDALSAMPRFCAAQTDDDYSVLDLAHGGMPETKKDYDGRRNNAEYWNIHTVSQLSLYRPGQTVNAAVYARRHTDRRGERAFAAWLPLAGEALQVEVLDRDGTVAHAFDATTNAYGSVAFSFTLAGDAEPGWYTVRAKAKTLPYEAAATPFQVASFRPPEFKVDITPPPSRPVPENPAERLPATVRAGYFSGALLAGGKVELHAEYTATRFTPPRLAGYATGPGSLFGRWSHHERAREAVSVSGTLDAMGNAALTLPPVTKSLSPRSLSLTATVTDAANLTSQGTASCLLHPSEYYIGIRAPYIVREKQDTPIQFKAATWDDAPLTGKAASLKAERITWKNGEKKLETVWEKPLQLTDATGDRMTVSFSRSGQYQLTASITDEKGRENVGTASVYVPGKDLQWGITRYDSGHLDLLAEEKTYTPGDTARLVVKNPFETATVLVAVERNGVRRSFVREVSGGDPVIDVPLEKADAPYVYATVLLTRGRTAPPPNASQGATPSATQGTPIGTLSGTLAAGPTDAATGVMDNADADALVRMDEGAPTLWQGGALLRVTGEEPALAASVTTDKREYRPGGAVTATASVTERGKGKKAQVTFLAVDERVLRAGGEFTTYNPYAAFGAQYPNTVFDTDTWSHLLRHHWHIAGPDMLLKSRMAVPMMAMAADSENVATAGGESSPALRSDFSPLAFWLGEGETDSAGTLAVTFTLPDSLTSYRVVAVAADTEDGFATAETSIRAAQPLQLLPALPKFVTEGDRLDAGFLVQNTGKERGEAEITLSVTGAALPPADNARRTIALEAGQSGLVAFPLRADALEGPAEELRLKVAARMGEETDAAEFTLPVKPALPMTYVAAAGILNEGETYTLPVKTPANLVSRSHMEVTFAPSPAAGIPLAAKQAIEYPWNCLEQRLSRAWSRIIRLEHGRLIGLAPDTGDRDAITKEFEALPAYQRQDGSFTLWPGMGATEDADGLNLFITAYALLVNREGAAAGVALPASVTDKALAYIEKILSGLPQSGTTRKRTNGGQTGYRPAPGTCALALHVLALHTPEKAAGLFPKVLALCGKVETSPLGWGALLLALNRMDAVKPVQDKAKTVALIMETLEKTAAVTPVHLHFASAQENAYWRTLGSTLRDNALLLAALATGKQDYPRLEALAAWVGQRIGDTRNLTTQEAAFGLWGLATYLASLGGDREIALRAVWNGRDEASAAFSRLMDPPTTWKLPAATLNGGKASNLNLTATAGKPYWTARLAYASPDIPVKAENAGFTLVRSVSGKGPWTVGDTVEVTVTVTVPATRRHVLLFDPFPAGFEPLFTSRVDLMAREQWKNSGFDYGPWRWRDTLDDGMLLYAPLVHPGTYTYSYKLRAAVSGTFTQRPSSVEEMYTPEVFGRTDKSHVAIRPK